MREVNHGTDDVHVFRISDHIHDERTVYLQFRHGQHLIMDSEE